MNLQEVVIKYLQKYPDQPNLTLARAIYKNEFPLFTNIDQVRSIVRRLKGSHGIKHRNSLKIRDYMKDNTKSSNPYNLPDSYESSTRDFILPLSDNNILLISDLHIPYHTISACSTALLYGKENKCNTIIINGDLLDFHGLSRFEKDPRKRTVKQELDAAMQFLDSLRKTFPRARIHWLKGNHDIRYEKWLMTRVVELFDDPHYELENRLQLNKFRVNILSDKTIIKAGKLNITHGHTIIRGVMPPVNIARGVFLRTKEPTIIGHTHKVSEHTETPLNKDIITCWSTGCLCELSPDYNPHCNNYAHGFAHIQISKDKSFHVKNFRILNGKIL